MRRIRFKPPLRQTMLANAAWLAAQSPDGKLPADLAATMARSLPAAPKRRKAVERMDGLDMDAIHGTKRTAPLESEVVRAISELLAAHPLVAHACRQNTGMASYEAASGKYAPVHFYKLLKNAGVITLPDFWGFLKGGRFFALEAKRENFKEPRDDRERKQANFLALVRNCGGIGAFVRSATEAKAAIES